MTVIIVTLLAVAGAGMLITFTPAGNPEDPALSPERRKTSDRVDV